MLGAGKDLAAVPWALEMSAPTYHRWWKQYGGMNAEENRRLRDAFLAREVFDRLARAPNVWG